MTYKPCDAKARIGGFLILHRKFEMDTKVSGKVESAVNPTTVRDVVAENGGCRLLKGRRLFCDPGCSSEQVCDGTSCIAAPRTQNVGKVDVTGLGTTVSLSPNAVAAYDSSMLDVPELAPGTPVSLRAAGGQVAAFSLRGEGVERIGAPDVLPDLQTDKPYTVTWTPAPAASPARMQFEVNIARHGAVTDARILCDDVEDTGSLTIPAALVAELARQGVSGFPTVTFARQTVDSAAVANGCVDLAVRSEAVRELKVAGFVSCQTADDPCPNGTTCNIGTQLCK